MRSHTCHRSNSIRPSPQMRLEDQYVQAIINRHRATPKHFPQLERLIQAWAGKNLESIALSGSHAKETALKDSDVDLFLSLKPEVPGPLAEIQSSLARHFCYYQPECRNVSVRIRFEGTAIDLVPGRRREGSSQHTLWQSRQDTWLQTDIAEQIQHVRCERTNQRNPSPKNLDPPTRPALPLVHARASRNPSPKTKSPNIQPIPVTPALFIRRLPQIATIRPSQHQQRTHRQPDRRTKTPNRASRNPIPKHSNLARNLVSCYCAPKQARKPAEPLLLLSLCTNLPSSGADCQSARDCKSRPVYNPIRLKSD